tara:strand:- start:522 stop:869 length:348 start_codon:yes stop_codon:yes gene_type:complete
MITPSTKHRPLRAIVRGQMLAQDVIVSLSASEVSGYDTVRIDWVKRRMEEIIIALLITKTAAEFGRRIQEAKDITELEAIGAEVAEAKGLTEDDTYLLRRTYAFWREELSDVGEI